MLAKRVERGSLIRLAQGIYSDDKVTSAAEQIGAAAIPIAAHLVDAVKPSSYLASA